MKAGGKTMKKLLASLLVMSLSVTAAGCFPFGSIVGRGPVETRSFDFSGFTRIETGNNFDVEVVRADAFSVTITTNENLFDYLDLEQTGDTLSIRLENGSYTFAEMKARVTMPDVFSLEVSGASKGKATGFDFAHALTLKASGASEIDLESIKAGETEVEVSGASRIRGELEAANISFTISGASSAELDGRGLTLDLTVSGASNANLRDFTVTNAAVNFSGASSGSVNAAGRLDVQLSGASSLRYFGDPQLDDVNTSGGSSLNKG
jgi:hypothetical protein